MQAEKGKEKQLGMAFASSDYGSKLWTIVQSLPPVTPNFHLLRSQSYTCLSLQIVVKIK